MYLQRKEDRSQDSYLITFKVILIHYQGHASTPTAKSGGKRSHPIHDATVVSYFNNQLQPFFRTLKKHQIANSR